MNIGTLFFTYSIETFFINNISSVLLLSHFTFKVFVSHHISLYRIIITIPFQNDSFVLTHTFEWRVFFIIFKYIIYNISQLLIIIITTYRFHHNFYIFMILNSITTVSLIYFLIGIITNIIISWKSECDIIIIFTKIYKLTSIY